MCATRRTLRRRGRVADAQSMQVILDVAATSGSSGFPRPAVGPSTTLAVRSTVNFGAARADSPAVAPIDITNLGESDLASIRRLL